MKMTLEMLKHIIDKTDTRDQLIEKAYALGIDAGHNVSRHTSQWDEHKALSSATKTIAQQEKFMAQLSQLVFEHKSLDARMLCLDHGWCINCYTYTCHGDCG